MKWKLPTLMTIVVLSVWLGGELVARYWPGVFGLTGHTVRVPPAKAADIRTL
jgi:hypothetical protein